MKNKIKSFLLKFLRAVSGRIPAKKGLWLFGAWAGNLYSDNSRYLFEYVSNEHPEIKAVWITRSGDIVERLKKEGYRCCNRRSLKGFWYTLRAEAAFVTAADVDINSYINPHKTMLVNLWHGLGVKDVKWKDKNGNIPDENSCAYMKNYVWFATSEYFVDTLSMQYFTDKAKFYITGFPRNDVFVTQKVNPYFEEFKKQYEGKKLLIYMPTHRNFGTEGNEAINKESLSHLNEILVKENCILVFKPHYYEIKTIEQMGCSYSNIVFGKDKEIWGDPYEYLYYFDGLISDYSSVASDFICTGKPAVLFPYDIEHYKTEDGGILPIFWNCPTGPSGMTWDEVIYTMLGLLENDDWKERREECRKKYHVFNDGRNCERAFETAEKLLKEKREM